MAEKTISAAYRITESLKNKLQELANEENLTAQTLFLKLVQAYDTCTFKTTDYGKAMENDLNDWAFHSASLQQLYENAIRNGLDAKEIVRQDFANRIRSAEEAVSSLKEKNDALNNTIKELNTQIQMLSKSLAEASDTADKYQEAARKADENAEAWKSSIKTLTTQLEEQREKIKKYDELVSELESTKSELASTKKVAEVQEQLIEKYMKRD